jgi:hypothetical protein
MRNDAQEVNTTLACDEHITIGWFVVGCEGSHSRPAPADYLTELFVLGSLTVGEDSETERIKRLRDLCSQLETLRKQTAEICQAVETEIRHVVTAGQRDRRRRTRKVRHDRRHKP